MADPRALFGERRLPQFLGGRRVDYYIPPEVRQGIGGLLAGLQAINPLTGLREYERSMREGDYPAAASEALMLAAPGAGALLARGIGRAVPSVVRAVDDAAEEGSVLLQETLSPVGAIDPRISDLGLLEEFRLSLSGVGRAPEEYTDAERLRLEDIANRVDAGEYDDITEQQPFVDTDAVLTPETADPGLEELFQAWEADLNLLNEQYNALNLMAPETHDQAYQIARQLRDMGAPLTDTQQNILDIYDPDPDFVDADFADVPELPSATIFNTPEGGARFYSPAMRAAGQLPQQVYGGLDELAAAMRSRGAKPEELRLLEETLYERTELGPQASQRIFRDTAQQVADEYVTWVSPVVRRFTGGRTDYDEYFTKGGKGYTEVAIGAPPAAVGANDGSIVKPPPATASRHFDLPSGTVAHYRAARFRTTGDEADAYHVGEVQSDWGQIRGQLPANENAAEGLLVELDKVIADRDAARTRYKNESAGPGSAADAFREYEALRDRVVKLREKRDMYSMYGTREDFDAAYEGVPYVGSTDKWSQLALKQALIDAANSDARYMTLGTGDMAYEMTGGDLEGQKKFYDEILPKNFKKILQRLASDAGIKAPEIVPREIMIQQGDAIRTRVPMTVLSIELTPELRRALSEVGLPSYRDGGLVSLFPM